MTDSMAFITRLQPNDGRRRRLAVKDNIDVRGVVTTAGSRLVSERATPAQTDADCVARFRSAGWAIVGKTNLHELAYGATGINAVFGTPRNPHDERLIPGGSSSGSAVAVGNGEADCAFGTDTAGSVRMPAACCGVVGLKFSNGRIPMAGVMPLAPSLDSLGLLTRTMDDLRVAAEVLGVEAGRERPGGLRVGRVRIAGVDNGVDSAVDSALEDAGYTCNQLQVSMWEEGHRAARTIIAVEAFRTISSLCSSPEGGEGLLGDDVAARLAAAGRVNEAQRQAALATKRMVTAEFERIFQSVDVLCLPTLAGPPPRLTENIAGDLAYLTAIVNLVGLPALAIPIPARDGNVASLQAIAPMGSEGLLLAFGTAIESACAAGGVESVSA